MIFVHEAKALVAAHCQPLLPVVLSLQQAAGHSVAQDIYTPVSLPSFAQSAMDGYAFCFDDYITSNTLYINGEVQAGNGSLISLLPRTAVRIFTGAPLPQAADTVVMQEKVLVLNN